MATDAPTPVSFGNNPDVIFIFPEDGGEKIFAEKLKLAQISEVFRKQFSGNFDCKEEIIIKDISFVIFEIILEHIYANDEEDAGDKDTIEVTEHNFLEILYMSSKYFIFSVIETVIEFVCSYLTEENLLDHYEALEKYQIRKLNDKMFEILVNHPITIIEGLNGSEIHMSVLKQILESPCLKIDAEYDLYAAVAAMMKKASKNAVDIVDEMRRKMGNLIYSIRFPIMSLDEIILCAKPPSLLTEKQLLDLLNWVDSGNYSESIQFFSTMKRYWPQWFDRTTAKDNKCSNCKAVLEGYCQYCRECKKWYKLP